MVLAALWLVQPGIAAAEDSDVLSGLWQADNGESRYKLEWCGPDGTALCATLVWIEPDKINDRNKQYLNTLVVDQARLASTKPLSWKGKINVYGNELDGVVTLVDDNNRFTVHGCAFIIICVDDGANKMAQETGN